jgi:hypothetical protein
MHISWFFPSAGAGPDEKVEVAFPGKFIIFANCEEVNRDFLSLSSPIPLTRFFRQNRG